MQINAKGPKKILLGALIQFIVFRLPKRFRHIQIIPLNTIQRPQIHSLDVDILQSFRLHGWWPLLPDLFRRSEDIGVYEDTARLAKFVSKKFAGELVGCCIFIAGDVNVGEGRVNEDVAILKGDNLSEEMV